MFDKSNACFFSSFFHVIQANVFLSAVLCLKTAERETIREADVGEKQEEKGPPVSIQGRGELP